MAEPLLLGAIADDHTGATDLAGALRAAGLRVVQLSGDRLATVGPEMGEPAAIVVAQKTRAAPRNEAVSTSLKAVRWLRQRGARQIYFKYCSTFDSTAEGNIGPITAALLDELGVSFTLAAPSFPANGRTLYLGHLFVADLLLSESPLRSHPVNPMTDPNLVRHLQRQTSKRVGLIPFPVVRTGTDAVRVAMGELERSGVQIALADAVADADLATLASAAADLPLLTGGSAFAAALGAHWVKTGVTAALPAWRADRERGPVLLLAGSCADRTLEQVAQFSAAGHPVLAVDVESVVGGGAAAVRTLEDQVELALTRSPALLVYAGRPEAERRAMLDRLDRRGFDAPAVRAAIESLMGRLARRFVDQGGRRLVVAGGETAGAVMEALDAAVLEIGPLICPGVPLCRTVGPRPVSLVLKSGNFGAPDLFASCLRWLRGEEPHS